MAMVLMRVDDLTAEEAAETVFFGLDADAYEIDLTAANAAELRAQLQPYIRAARRTGWRRLPPQSLGPWQAHPSTQPLAGEMAPAPCGPPSRSPEKR
jgi:hypothetical protein